MIHLALRLGALVLVGLVVLAIVPASGDAHDVEVVANAQWHSTTRYWDVDALNVVDIKPSKVVNFEAWTRSTFFFGSAPEYDVVFSLTGPGYSEEIFEETPDGGVTNFGREAQLKAIFHKVPAGEYTLSVRIPGEDHAFYEQETKTIRVGDA